MPSNERNSVVYRGSQYTKLPLSLAAAKNKFYISQREARTDSEPDILFWSYAYYISILPKASSENRNKLGTLWICLSNRREQP